MITLALDTSTPRGAVALLRDDKPLAEEAFDRSQAGQNLFDTAAKLLSENHLTVSDIGLLAVGLGTGLVHRDSSGHRGGQGTRAAAKTADQGYQQLRCAGIDRAAQDAARLPATVRVGRRPPGRNLFRAVRSRGSPCEGFAGSPRSKPSPTRFINRFGLSVPKSNDTKATWRRSWAVLHRLRKRRYFRAPPRWAGWRFTAFWTMVIMVTRMPSRFICALRSTGRLEHDRTRR